MNVWFQSAPLTEARGDNRLMLISLALHCFNPLPSPKQGETQSLGHRAAAIPVSIRSPHRSKGRPRAWDTEPLPSLFQSAPLTEARGDRYSIVCLSFANVFQSAPLTEARGDPELGTPSRCHPCFNPLPSPKQGETDTRLSVCLLLMCFNPLPSPKQGETAYEWLWGELGGVSIRSPHRSKGRPNADRSTNR